MFMPHCNTNITSDAKVGIHMLAGSARAAYQVRLYLRHVHIIAYLDAQILIIQLTFYTVGFELILS